MPSFRLSAFPGILLAQIRNRIWEEACLFPDCPATLSPLAPALNSFQILAEARLWPVLQLGLISSTLACGLVRGQQRNRTDRTYRDIYKRRFILRIGSHVTEVEKSRDQLSTS